MVDREISIKRLLSSSRLNRRCLIAGLTAGGCLSQNGARSASGGLMVTADIAGERLGDALPVVGETSGFALGCGKNAADRRLFLLCRKRPFEDFKGQLRSFVPFPPGTGLWYKSGRIEVFDEDTLSHKSRLDAALHQADTEAAWRAGGLRDSEEWSRAGGGDKDFSERARRDWSNGLKLFRSLPPSAQRDALRGKRTSLRWSQLNADGRSAVSGLLRHKHTGAEETEFHFAWPKDLPQVRVQFLPARMGSDGRSGLCLAIETTPVTVSSIPDLARRPAKNAGGAWEYIPGQIADARKPRGPKGAEAIDALQKRISLQSGRLRTIAPVLRELSERSQLPLIGEYDPVHDVRPADWTETFPSWAEFEKKYVSLSDTVEKEPVHRALEIVCRQFDLNWDYRDGWIWIKSPRTLPAVAGLVDLSPPADGEQARK